MDWKHLLAYITGTVDQELLLRNEYLVTENRILRHQITGRVRLTDGERQTLAAIGQKLVKQALAEVAKVSYGATYGDKQSFQAFLPLPGGKLCRKWCPWPPA